MANRSDGDDPLNSAPHDFERGRHAKALQRSHAWLLI
jgi:hypothetical protein